MMTFSVIGKLILPDGGNWLGGYIMTVSVIGNLILPDGRNRLEGYLTNVSVICNNDGWWNGWLHDDRLANR